MDYLHEITFLFDDSLRSQFRTGDLVEKWKSRYGEIFDDNDFKIWNNQKKLTGKPVYVLRLIKQKY